MPMQRTWSISALLAVCFFATVALVPAQNPIEAPPLPVMKAINPTVATVGQLVTITGDNLGKRLAAVYLTDGKNDFKLTLLEKSETTLKVKIPAGTPQGHFRLMALTSDDPGLFVEQPPCLDVVAIPTGD
jgi:hypothetical protein